LTITWRIGRCTGTYFTAKPNTKKATERFVFVNIDEFFKDRLSSTDHRAFVDAGHRVALISRAVIRHGDKLCYTGASQRYPGNVNRTDWLILRFVGSDLQRIVGSAVIFYVPKSGVEPDGQLQAALSVLAGNESLWDTPSETLIFLDAKDSVMNLAELIPLPGDARYTGNIERLIAGVSIRESPWTMMPLSSFAIDTPMGDARKLDAILDQCSPHDVLVALSKEGTHTVCARCCGRTPLPQGSGDASTHRRSLRKALGLS
jgi:hypothetical protein